MFVDLFKVTLAELLKNLHKSHKRDLKLNLLFRASEPASRDTHLPVQLPDTRRCTLLVLWGARGYQILRQSYHRTQRPAADGFEWRDSFQSQVPKPCFGEVLWGRRTVWSKSWKSKVKGKYEYIEKATIWRANSVLPSCNYFFFSHIITLLQNGE